MECKDARENVLASAGTKESPPGELRRHLEGCAECRALWERSAGVWKLLGEHPEIEPSAGFNAGVRRRIRRAPMWRIVMPAAAAAAILLIFLFAGSDPAVNSDGSGLAPEELEIVQNLDLLENLEMLQAMEVVGETDVESAFTWEN